MNEMLKPFSEAYFSWLWIILTIIGGAIGWHCSDSRNYSLFIGWMAFTFACGIGAWIGY